MITRTEPRLRTRIANLMVASLVVGWTAALAVKMAPAAKPVAVAAPLSAPVAVMPTTVMAIAPRPIVTATATPSERLEMKQARVPANSSGVILQDSSESVVVNARGIVLSDKRKPRVGTQNFKPVRSALVKFMANSNFPEVRIRASDDVPPTHVAAVSKFMTRFYGWPVKVEAASTSETFELQVSRGNAR